MFHSIRNFISADECTQMIDSVQGTTPVDRTPRDRPLRLHYSWQDPQLILRATSLVRSLVSAPLWCNTPTAQIFCDPAGYTIAPHVDTSANMWVNLQIYLTGGAEPLATHSVIDGVEYSADYAVGSGYVLVGADHYYHGMHHTVPEGHTRWSWYCSWRREETVYEW